MGNGQTTQTVQHRYSPSKFSVVKCKEIIIPEESNKMQSHRVR